MLPFQGKRFRELDGEVAGCARDTISRIHEDEPHILYSEERDLDGGLGKMKHTYEKLRQMVELGEPGGELEIRNSKGSS